MQQTQKQVSQARFSKPLAGSSEPARVFLFAVTISRLAPARTRRLRTPLPAAIQCRFREAESKHSIRYELLDGSPARCGDRRLRRACLAPAARRPQVTEW